MPCAAPRRRAARFMEQTSSRGGRPSSTAMGIDCKSGRRRSRACEGNSAAQHTVPASCALLRIPCCSGWPNTGRRLFLPHHNGRETLPFAPHFKVKAAHSCITGSDGTQCRALKSNSGAGLRTAILSHDNEASACAIRCLTKTKPGCERDSPACSTAVSPDRQWPQIHLPAARQISRA